MPIAQMSELRSAEHRVLRGVPKPWGSGRQADDKIASKSELPPARSELRTFVSLAPIAPRAELRVASKDSHGSEFSNPKITGLSLENHSDVRRFIAEYAQRLGATNVEVIDASDDDRLLREAEQGKELIKLPDGNYYARSHPKDVARTEERTFVSTPDPDDQGSFNNWKMAGEQTLATVHNLMEGSAKGKTIYAIPFLMAVPDSEFAKVGVQLTDSRYVAVNMIRMARVGKVALEEIARKKDFIKAVHVTGDLDKIYEKLEKTKEDDRHFISFPHDGLVLSYGSAYGGNALLAKKFLALRQASYDARKEGWLAEHMMIIGIEDLQTKTTKYIAAAFPSASGKTNLAMLTPPDDLKDRYRVHLIGDDIAWLRPGKDGRIYAMNPENGFFGVVPGTNWETNANAMKAIGPGTKTIFTNVAINEKTGELWWEGKTEAPPGFTGYREGDVTYSPQQHYQHWLAGKEVPKPNFDGWRDWQGNYIQDRTLEDMSKPWAHPNSRFTTAITNAPNLSPHFEDPKGVPIDIILWGGRVRDREPLIRELSNIASGVYDGFVMGVETTAAAAGKVGVLREDPFAQRPFYAYHEADHSAHFLKVMERLSHPPRFFHVNWFRKGKDGKFIWPGYSENLRPILWAIARTEGNGEGVKTPLGVIPTIDASEFDGARKDGVLMTRKMKEDALLISADSLPNWRDEIFTRRAKWLRDPKRSNKVDPKIMEQQTKLEANWPDFEEALQRSELRGDGIVEIPDGKITRITKGVFAKRVGDELTIKSRLKNVSVRPGKAKLAKGKLILVFAGDSTHIGTIYERLPEIEGVNFVVTGANVSQVVANREFALYLDLLMDKEANVVFNISVTGEAMASRLGFGPGFASLYDQLVAKFNAHPSTGPKMTYRELINLGKGLIRATRNQASRSASAERSFRQRTDPPWRRSELRNLVVITEAGASRQFLSKQGLLQVAQTAILTAARQFIVRPNAKSPTYISGFREGSLLYGYSYRFDQAVENNGTVIEFNISKGQIKHLWGKILVLPATIQSFQMFSQNILKAIGQFPDQFNLRTEDLEEKLLPYIAEGLLRFLEQPAAYPFEIGKVKLQVSFVPVSDTIYDFFVSVPKFKTLNHLSIAQGEITTQKPELRSDHDVTNVLPEAATRLLQKGRTIPLVYKTKHLKNPIVVQLTAVEVRRGLGRTIRWDNANGVFAFTSDEVGNSIESAQEVLGYAQTNEGAGMHIWRGESIAETISPEELLQKVLEGAVSYNRSLDRFLLVSDSAPQIKPETKTGSNGAPRSELRQELLPLVTPMPAQFSDNFLHTGKGYSQVIGSPTREGLKGVRMHGVKQGKYQLRWDFLTEKIWDVIRLKPAVDVSDQKIVLEFEPSEFEKLPDEITIEFKNKSGNTIQMATILKTEIQNFSWKTSLYEDFGALGEIAIVVEKASQKAGVVIINRVYVEPRENDVIDPVAGKRPIVIENLKRLGGEPGVHVRYDQRAFQTSQFSDLELPNKPVGIQHAGISLLTAPEGGAAILDLQPNTVRLDEARKIRVTIAAPEDGRIPTKGFYIWVADTTDTKKAAIAVSVNSNTIISMTDREIVVEVPLNNQTYFRLSGPTAGLKDFGLISHWVSLLFHPGHFGAKEQSGYSEEFTILNVGLVLNERIVASKSSSGAQRIVYRPEATEVVKKAKASLPTRRHISESGFEVTVFTEKENENDVPFRVLVGGSLVFDFKNGRVQDISGIGVKDHHVTDAQVESLGELFKQLADENSQDKEIFDSIVKKVEALRSELRKEIGRIADSVERIGKTVIASSEGARQSKIASALPRNDQNLNAKRHTLYAGDVSELASLNAENAIDQDALLEVKRELKEIYSYQVQNISRRNLKTLSQTAQTVRARVFGAGLNSFAFGAARQVLEREDGPVVFFVTDIREEQAIRSLAHDIDRFNERVLIIQLDDIQGALQVAKQFLLERENLVGFDLFGLNGTSDKGVLGEFEELLREAGVDEKNIDAIYFEDPSGFFARYGISRMLSEKILQVANDLKNAVMA
ncbi:MAG: phosphoenolpyruvate carboxykinase (GTP) [Candidatus Omnitrophica bacterium]|nr:phosphoenolpyruvate carboxykinase (GTP) [Candidatus Omnitrophota bacterium]